jgi:cephalosporin hydroxylase
MKLVVDLERRTVSVEGGPTHPLSSPEAFSLVSRAWLQCGWDTKYVYTFTWLGRPVIQLPEDLIRIQEVIYRLEPDVILETGIAHGGSLVFYATLCRLMGRGRVIGVDVALREHNRRALQQHELAPHITLVDGSSVDTAVVAKVRSMVAPGETVLVVLDSNHSRDHVLAELEAYSGLVSPGSYIVATDGIMRDLVGAPRSAADWGANNPFAAAEEFLRRHSEFALEPPEWLFNESEGLREAVTYWPGAWLRRLR